MPTTTVTANPAIADHDALPLREASAYTARWMSRTTAYVPANTIASLPNACGTASPATKMKTVAVSSAASRLGDPAACAFAAHTNADHAHHTRARTSIERPNPAH